MSEVLNEIAIADYSGYKVLVFQNNGAGELIEYFEFKGCVPTLATDKDVINAIKSDLYDLYIIDTLEGDDLLLYKVIKSIKPSAIVWVVTEERTSEQITELYERGIDLYVERPTDLSVLFALFASTMRNRVVRPISQYETFFNIGKHYEVDIEGMYLNYTAPESGDVIRHRLSEAELKVVCLLYAHVNNTVYKADLVKNVLGVVDSPNYAKIVKAIENLKRKLKYDESIDIRVIYKTGYMMIIRDEKDKQ